MSTPVWRLSPPTRFGERYADDLAGSDIDVFLDANCVGLDDSGRLLLVLDEVEKLKLNNSGALGVGFHEHPELRAGYILVSRHDVEGDTPRFQSMIGFGDDDGTRFKVGVGIKPEVA